MSIVNGIIQAPVSIADVKTVLGETSNDLATLCKSEKINMWAKFKPVELKRPFTNDEFDFQNNRWRDDAVWFKGVNFEEDGVCGLKVTHGGSLSAVIDLYDKNTAGWKKRSPPTSPRASRWTKRAHTASKASAACLCSIWQAALQA